MIKIKEAVLVEGKYDKIKLQGIIDAPIITTNGFRVFKDAEKQQLIRRLAETRGLLIITDSDSAGMMIRNFIRGIVSDKYIKQCYIPQLKGKESRKSAPSKEGYLGVEGVDDDVIKEALKKSTVSVVGEDEKQIKGDLTKADLFDLGLTGRADSKQKRDELLRKLSLPTYLSTNAMLEYLNVLFTKDELKKVIYGNT